MYRNSSTQYTASEADLRGNITATPPSFGENLLIIIKGAGSRFSVHFNQAALQGAAVPHARDGLRTRWGHDLETVQG